MRWPSLIPILALTLSAAAAAQSETPPRADEPVLDLDLGGLVEVSEVLLDVLATDAEGNVVTGLGKDDFIVEENGEPVQLTSASYYTTRYGGGGEATFGGAEAAGVEEVPSSRYFILFFHQQWQLSFRTGDLRESQAQAGKESRRWLRDEMLPSDWVAVVSYGLGLKVYQDFTQDRDLLRRAIRHAQWGRWQSDLPSRRRSRDSFELSVLSRMPRGQELRRRTKTVYGALEALAEACAYVVGRKNLLMFTIGFGNERHFGQARADPRLYPRLETALNDHNVAVYPIDLARAGRVTRQAEFLTRLAEDTGGAYHRDFDRFLHLFRDVGGDNYAYYLLSYQTEHPAGEIGYRRVEVRARDESVQVRSRKGYRYGL